LTGFSVSGNALNGTLPDTIGQWTGLTSFLVGANMFKGTIPLSIGNWSLIVAADFSQNQFIGTMPNAICQYIDPPNDNLLADRTLSCTCCSESCT
jgi:hypothetical protein